MKKKMVRITEELVRKKSEHNEGVVGTLEELSLHQEDVERIEFLQDRCRDLQILYLQANLISRIENLNRLKRLKYLNLAVNNVERIENLERCESLEKLDLTLNFIGELESVGNLRDNFNLRELYLTGNPCCDFEGYREYVVAKLPQLKSLDVKEISRSERLVALRNFPGNEAKILNFQQEYRKFRETQKRRLSGLDSSTLSDEDFWKSSSENCPETRVEISRRQRKSRKIEENSGKSPGKSLRLFGRDGNPLNVNQAKINFEFHEDYEDPGIFLLDLEVYRFLDTNLIEVDLQPIYVRITVKGKVFQIVFPEEISIDKSVAQRSQTTGHLVLKMPKLNYLDKGKKPRKNLERDKKPEFLEVKDNRDEMDFSKIVESSNRIQDLHVDVPALEYF